jgi:hypothetical protein
MTISPEILKLYGHPVPVTQILPPTLPEKSSIPIKWGLLFILIGAVGIISYGYFSSKKIRKKE